MKATLYDIKGSKKGDVEMPAFFDSRVREDMVTKCVEVEKLWNMQMQPYTHYAEAGKRHSASGTISHRRHEWKGHYGKGISRVPRKAMWRRGTQFYWIATEVASTRGGRRAHGPIGALRRTRKLNSKELTLAFTSALASTADSKFLVKRYSSISDIKQKVPFVIESNLDKIKTKDFLAALKLILGDLYNLALKNKEVRTGRGKMRGRKYKSNAGLLLIKSKSENVKISGIDVKSTDEVNLTDLYPLGRLTIYTQKALEELKNVA